MVSSSIMRQEQRQLAARARSMSSELPSGNWRSVLLTEFANAVEAGDWSRAQSYMIDVCEVLAGREPR